MGLCVLKRIKENLTLVVSSPVLLPQVVDERRVATARPIREERTALLLLHVLQVLDYLQASLLQHLVLLVWSIAIELRHKEHVLGKTHHLLRHLVRDFSSGAPTIPRLVNLVACEIYLRLPRSSSFSLLVHRYIPLFNIYSFTIFLQKTFSGVYTTIICQC